MQQLGHGEDYFEGSIWLADSNYHSDGNLKSCEEEKLDTYIPDTNFRKRDLRFASQERHKPPKRKKFSAEDFTYEEATDRPTNELAGCYRLSCGTKRYAILNLDACG